MVTSHAMSLLFECQVIHRGKPFRLADRKYLLPRISTDSLFDSMGFGEEGDKKNRN